MSPESLIEIFKREARATIEEWLSRWSEENGDSIRVRYMEDGTAEIERETDTGSERESVHFGVAAVPAPREPNKPVGFKGPRKWCEIPAGWWVSTPNGERFEVLATKAAGAMQEVTLRIGPDKIGTWPRPANAEVWCQRGTHTKALDEAMDALSASFGPVTVIEDESPPWNP